MPSLHPKNQYNVCCYFYVVYCEWSCLWRHYFALVCCVGTQPQKRPGNRGISCRIVDLWFEKGISSVWIVVKIYLKIVWCDTLIRKSSSNWEKMPDWGAILGCEKQRVHVKRTYPLRYDTWIQTLTLTGDTALRSSTRFRTSVTPSYDNSMCVYSFCTTSISMCSGSNGHSSPPQHHKNDAPHPLKRLPYNVIQPRIITHQICSKGRSSPLASTYVHYKRVTLIKHFWVHLPADMHALTGWLCTRSRKRSFCVWINRLPL